MPKPSARLPLYGWLASVSATDRENRRITIKYYGSDRTASDVVVVNSYGDYSFPQENDQVVVIELNRRVYCLGKIEGGYVDKLNGEYRDKKSETNPLAKKVSDGETFFSNLVKRSWLYLANSGNFSLMNGLNEGFKYLYRSRMAQIAGMAVNIIGNSANINIGSVMRFIPGSGDTVFSSDSPTTPAVEALIDIISNSIRKARIHIGEIKDSLGNDEFGSWGPRLRAIIEACSSAGTPIAVLKMDETGNIELSSVSGITMLDGNPTSGVLLGGLSAAFSSVLGEVLIEWLNTHTHPTGTGPSGSPNIPADSDAMLSKKVKVSS